MKSAALAAFQAAQELPENGDAEERIDRDGLACRTCQNMRYGGYGRHRPFCQAMRGMPSIDEAVRTLVGRPGCKYKPLANAHESPAADAAETKTE